MICRTRAGLLEFRLKATGLPLQPFYGGLWVEHGLGDVMTKGADDAEPMAGAGPCPGQDVFSGAPVAADLGRERLGVLTPAQETAQPFRQKLRIFHHALHARTGH